MLNNDEKIVSIGLPVYNGEKFLSQALNSLLSQTHKNFELIISDNASLDSTQRICEELVKKDKRISYIRQKENIGVNENFKFVLQQAKGKYFMWASDDDVWDSQFIEECIKMFNIDKETIMVFSNFVKINELGDITEAYTPEKFFPFEKNIYQRLKQYLLLSCRDGKANIIYGLWVRKELIQVPIFSFPSWGSDMNFVFRALSQGRFDLVNRMLFFKRVESCSSPKILFPLKVFTIFLHRVKILFSPYIYTYIVDIFHIKQLSFTNKLKLFFYTFLIMGKLFLSRRI